MAHKRLKTVTVILSQLRFNFSSGCETPHSLHVTTGCLVAPEPRSNRKLSCTAIPSTNITNQRDTIYPPPPPQCKINVWIFRPPSGHGTLVRKAAFLPFTDWINR